MTDVEERIQLSARLEKGAILDGRFAGQARVGLHLLAKAYSGWLGFGDFSDPDYPVLGIEVLSREGQHPAGLLIGE